MGNVTPATIHSLELQYGLNSKQGLWGQYTTFWVHLLHGNLGVSTSYYPSTVTSVIRSALPWTIGLVGLATVISFVLGTVLGVAGRLAARHLAGQPAPGHHVLPGRAVLLRRLHRPGRVRHPAGLVPHRPGL